MTVDAAREVLRSRGTVVLVDWPSRDVPETLVRAGWAVHVKGGPDPEDFSAWELQDGAVAVRRTGRAPDHIDVLYVHRPVEELPALVQFARDRGARVLWYQSGLAPDGSADPRGCWLPAERSALVRAQVEAAGMAYVDDRSIVDAVADRRP
jgi:predicted CoA-binding protein